MVTLDRVERAIDYFREHADQYGFLVGHCKGLEHQRKVVYGQCFLEAKGGTVAEREAKAYVSPEYKSLVEEIENAWAERTTLETLFECGRMVYGVYKKDGDI
jgi:hypothetical protein